MTMLRVVIVGLSVALCAGALAEEAVPTISPAELHAQQQKGTAPLVLDVRTPEEFAEGHVPGAVNIPHTDLGARLSEVQSENGVALYCMVGPRARMGEKTLQDAGFEKVFHLDGGLAAWQQAGFPVDASSE
jgi:rhodanese-related sulfurtransferase